MNISTTSHTPAVRFTLSIAMVLLTLLLVVVGVGGAPLLPGQPGGEWSQEEVAVVRDKVGIS